MTWTHRTFSVSLGQGGFQLHVVDEWWLAAAVGRAVENVLAALGHPCCGRGPLGRLPVLDHFWHRVLNLPLHLPHRSRTVVGLPLSDTEAALLAPVFVAEPAGVDDE